MTARLSDNAPAAVPVPEVLYLSERVQVGRRLWWRGVPERCAECSPAGMLLLDPPEGRTPGSLYCLSCGRAPYEVRESRRKAPLSVFVDDDGNHVKPLNVTGPERTPRTPRVRCADCGKPIRKDYARCGECYAVVQRVAMENRAPCIGCGGETAFGRSAKYCGSCLAKKKRGTLALRAEGV